MRPAASQACRQKASSSSTRSATDPEPPERRWVQGISTTTSGPFGSADSRLRSCRMVSYPASVTEQAWPCPQAIAVNAGSSQVVVHWPSRWMRSVPLASAASARAFWMNRPARSISSGPSVPRFKASRNRARAALTRPSLRMATSCLKRSGEDDMKLGLPWASSIGIDSRCARCPPVPGAEATECLSRKGLVGSLCRL